MRLTVVRSSLPLVLVATMLCGEQAKHASAPKASQSTSVKDSSAQTTLANAARKTQVHHRGTKSRKAAKRPEYRPEYTQNAVEVMNGESTQKVVFHNDDARTPEKDKAEPGYKVEVVNGAALDTQYFNADNARTGSDEKRPVVVAVQSSDTRVAGGNKHPVVTGVTSAGRVDAKSASNGGQKVTTGISPQPKRQAYQPDAP